MNEDNIIHLAKQVKNFGNDYRMWWYKKDNDPLYYLGVIYNKDKDVNDRRIYDLYFLDGTLARTDRMEGIIIRILTKMELVSPTNKKIILI